MSDAVTLGACSTKSLAASDVRQLMNELREQNCDTIRFATYRTACKLRFLQKKFCLHLIDIWNLIESFRENGLNAVDYNAEVKVSRVELLLSTVYHNLNKRLPVALQINTDRAITMLLSFLLAAYDREETGKLKLFSVKVALATLCAGKLIDKLRYIFSQISDADGVMDMQRFKDYLREVLALPTAVFEGPTFGYSEAAAKNCFNERAKVKVNMFLETMLEDCSPPCLIWLPLIHRMANVEHVYHPVVCDACGRDSFVGFRYKCQRCHNYQLCQDCFWRGRVSGSHTNQHEMKEYSSYKSPARQLTHSIGKTLRCFPSDTGEKMAVFPEFPEKHIDLTNVVPPPSAFLNGYQNPFGGRYYCDEGSVGSDDSFRCSGLMGQNDEHKLIARYSAKLASRCLNNPALSVPHATASQKALLSSLEQKNKDILREIQRLQALQMSASLSSQCAENDGRGLATELCSLRQRKEELERKMISLQDGRRDLMLQLERLMRALKMQEALGDGTSQSPTSVSGGALSPFRDGTPIASLSRATLPPGVHAANSLQSDLLTAADSITNTMSFLVKELGTGGENDKNESIALEQ